MSQTSTTTLIEIIPPAAISLPPLAILKTPAFESTTLHHDTPTSSTSKASSIRGIQLIGSSSGGALESQQTLSTDKPDADMPKLKAALVIITVASVTFLNSMFSGILTVGLPTIAADLALQPNLLLWPASVYALTCGCTLLLSGAIADVVGSRFMYLTGCGMLAAFTLGCGLARTGIQLILCRAFAGIAISFCLPSAVSIITDTFSTGQRRNIAFASLGAAQPVGFSAGLVLGGVLIDSVGWRYGYYIGAGITVLIFLSAMWGLPKNSARTAPVTWRRFAYDIDWVGATLASSSLGMISYVFAMATASISRLRDPMNITLLCIAVALLPTFVLWVSRQERLGRPAIIPNSLWRNRVFTCICIVVFLCWAVFNAVQYFITLFFQEVQNLSVLQTSLRFLPMVFSGCLTNVATGFLVQRVRANILVVGAGAITCLAPLMMAIANPSWTYWSCAFIATLLSPIGADTLFTVSNLVITSVFPPRTHGLAGGVFNTLSQIGNSVGLAVTAILASSVTARSHPANKSSPEALMQGYRATFWACLGAMLLTVLISACGLRRIGKVGLKKE
ncbi:MAG: hypothetical protein M1819_006774 [Sarea resinae]|nr:MAG: hypothetical protein M1819_006774 [Sarea resinae]